MGEESDVGREPRKRTATSGKSTRGVEHFALLEGLIPKILYDAMVFVYRAAKRVLTGRIPDAREQAEDIMMDFAAEQHEQQLAELLKRDAAGRRSYSKIEGKHRAMDHLKSAAVAYSDRLPDNLEELHLASPADSAASEQFDREGLGQEVERAMREIKPAYREILRLRVRLEMSYDEIGRELGISEDNARQRVTRALKKMKELIGVLRRRQGDSHDA